MYFLYYFLETHEWRCEMGLLIWVFSVFSLRLPRVATTCMFKTHVGWGLYYVYSVIYLSLPGEISNQQPPRSILLATVFYLADSTKLFWNLFPSRAHWKRHAKQYEDMGAAKLVSLFACYYWVIHSDHKVEKKPWLHCRRGWLARLSVSDFALN